MAKQGRGKSKSRSWVELNRNRAPIRLPHIETISVGQPQVYTVQIYPPIITNFHMPVTPIHPTPSSMSCPSCGYENGIDFLFCNKCGTELEGMFSDRS